MPHPTLQDAPVSRDRRRVQRADPDQRQAPRLQLDQAAVVTVLGTPKRVFKGEIRNLSEGGTQIRLDEPLSPSTLVRIEHNDSLLLGEVVYCQQEQSDWLVGVKIEHGLFELTALADAMRGF